MRAISSLSNNSVRCRTICFAVNSGLRHEHFGSVHHVTKPAKRDRDLRFVTGTDSAEPNPDYAEQNFAISLSNPSASRRYKEVSRRPAKPLAEGNRKRTRIRRRGTKARMPISADNRDPSARSDDASGNRIYLDTSQLPERDRLPALCNTIRSHIFGCDVALPTPGPFCATLDLRWAGTVGVAQIATSPIDIVRDATFVSPENDRVIVQLLQHGTATLLQEGHEISADAGESIVLDCREASRLRITETTSAWLLIFSRHEIARPKHRARRLAGTKLTDESLLRLLSGYLDSMWKEDFSDHRAAQTIGGHLADLIALALSQKDASHFATQSGLRAARVVEVLQLISDQIGNPGLSVAGVAEQMGVTPRYIHLLLEQSDKTFAKHVLQKRLERALELLSADTRGDRRIADIATAAGFSDLSYFNRAFRRQFGDTPSRIRASGAARLRKASDI